tara:strand:+ start:109 stop:243 length:135 start_codon:yes stop_codon:yes gene_type:complete
MDWRDLDDRIDDYVMGRRWNESECWIEPKGIDVKELREIFDTKY